MFKLVLVVYFVLGTGGSASRMETTVMPGTYATCPGSVSYTSIKDANDIRVGVVCVPAGVAAKN